MYRSILVPLDGSHMSEQSLPTAIDLCRRSTARLHLVQVRAPARPAAPRTPQMPWSNDAEHAYVTEIVERAAAELGESVSFAILSRDEARLRLPSPLAEVVARRINEYARAQQIDLILMVTHGRGGFSRAWFGSVTEVLLRIADVPLLLLHPRKGGKQERAPEPLRQVLIPLDGTPESEAVLGPARELGAANVEFTLLRVVPLPLAAFDPGGTMVFSPTPQQVDQWRAAAEADLARTAGHLRETGATVTVSIVLAASPATTILQFASVNDIDLIALTTHARRGMQRIVLGSVADKVIRGAECPVLVLRPDAGTFDAAQPVGGQAAVNPG